MSDPFFYPAADEPYIEATMGCILVGENLQVCNETLCRTSAPVPVPMRDLTARGDLVSAVAGPTGPISSPVPLGNQGEWLGVTGNTPTALQWTNMPDESSFISECEFTAKGDLLVGNGSTQPLAPTATALPVGTDGQVLIADSEAPLALKWVPNLYSFTQVGQLLASDSNCNPVRISGTLCDILYYNSLCLAGWTGGVKGQALFAPHCTEKGSLIVGCGIDESRCFYPINQNGQVLAADSICPLGLKYCEPASGYQTTTGTCYSNTDSSQYQKWDELPSTAFPAGSKVFVQTTFSIQMVTSSGLKCGCLNLCQGNSQSMPICWIYPHRESGNNGWKNSSVSYIVPSWDANCALSFQIRSEGDIDYNLELQTSAFVLQT